MSEIRGRRRWVLGVVTATVIPALLVLGLELGLRVGGYGVPGSFFVPVEGREGVLTSNPRYGWRFFPPRLARQPVVAEMTEEKGDGVYRVFVLGGSAALGTPEPAVGMPRMFEALLREAWPERRFEVVTMAMAAVNSHVVRLAAREAAAHDPDLFLVYLGNNEVVGPYGPGSVFGRATPRLGMVRAALFARGTRLGQLLRAPAAALDGLGDGETEADRWRGLEMFVDRRLAADDPRLAAVYDHLEANLRDVVAAGTGAGADVALSIVAVNLRDLPPFASTHRDGLGAAEAARWEAAVARGEAAAREGRAAEAVESFAAAAAIDDRHAGLRYRLGRAWLAAGRADRARPHLVAARDLDTLRFRADGRVNEVIRRVAAAGGERLHSVDAEAALGAAGAVPGLPGDELFWEHVHLRPAGNYLLARAFFDRLRPVLEARLGGTAGEPASAERCAEILGLTVPDRRGMAEAIVHMTAGRPPFAGQPGAAARELVRRREVRGLRAREAGPRAAAAALAAERRAVEGWPDDLLLRADLAGALHRAGRPAEAAAEWRRLVERLPGVVEWRTGLGFALADAGDTSAAEAELRRALELSGGTAEARVNLGTVLEAAGEADAAEAQYRLALEERSSSQAARLNLARLLERRGHWAEAAAEYRRAVADHPAPATALRRFGEALDRRGDLAAAEERYRAALRLDPNAASVHNNLGSLLERRGQPAAAADSYAAATRADPGHALAWFNLADLLLAYGRAAEAVPAYRRALELEPGNEQGRRNLEIALGAGGVALLNPDGTGAGSG